MRALDAVAGRLAGMVPNVLADAARARCARLLGAVSAGAVLWLLGLCLILPTRDVSATFAAAITLVLVLAISALAAATRGRLRLAEAAALAAGVSAAAAMASLGGSLSSPLMLAAPALAVETWRVGRCSGAWRAGALAAAVSLLLAWAMSAVLPAQPAPHAVFWLPVAAWAVLVAGGEVRRAGATAHHDILRASLASDAVVFQFETGGDATDVSPAARTMLALAPELLLAGGLFDRLHVADRVVFLCALSDMRQSARRRTIALRVRLPRGAGAMQDCYGSFSLELLHGGDAAAPFIGYLREDAESESHRRELEQAQNAAERSGREKFELMAKLGHELRTPLNAITGFAEMLGHESLGGFRDARQREYASLIGASGAHLLSVADAMLDAGRHGATATPRRERFALCEAVETCRSMVALDAARKGVTIVLESNAAGMVDADRRIVQQVLLNLLSNAVKFTPAGGRVAIAAESLQSELRLSVTDNGVGMDEDDVASLGTPYARFGRGGAQDGEGTGIGLALVKELVALHGGRFRAASRPGQGTVVTVAFSREASGRDADALSAAPMQSQVFLERSRHGAIRKTA